MENQNKTLWVILGVVVIALVVVLIVRGTGKKMNDQVPAGGDVPATQEPAGTEDVSGTQGTTAGTAVSIAYQDALVKYADRRIQFNAQCQAVPNTVTYKDNSGIMLDNRSNVTRTIKVGTTYTIKPYGFRIITLPNTSLVKGTTLLVDCDKSQNVATVLVQE